MNTNEHRHEIKSACEDGHTPIETTIEAIEMARQLLAEADAHYLLREYKQRSSAEFELLSQETRKCLVLARVAVALALDIERGDAE